MCAESEINVGYQFSTSLNAAYIRFSGGGPYDGKKGLFDCDHDNFIISVREENTQYDYRRIGPSHFGLHTVWINGNRFLIRRD